MSNDNSAEVLLVAEAPLNIWNASERLSATNFLAFDSCTILHVSGQSNIFRQTSIAFKTLSCKGVYWLKKLYNEWKV